MGVTRIRPSRQVVKTTITVANLPDAAAAAKSSTWKVENIPSRGIIHRCELLITDGAEIDEATDIFKFLIHTSGSVTSTGGGDAGLATLAVESSLLIAAFKQTDNAAGDEALASGLYGATYNFVNTDNQIAYDVTGAVLGPNEVDGTLYFSLSNDDAVSPFNWTGLDSAAMYLEIEPCF